MQLRATHTLLSIENQSNLDTPLTDPKLPYFEIVKGNKYGAGKIIRALRLEPDFPRAKFISIAKYNEAKETKIVGGYRRRLKSFAIGVLTTDNYFYYNRFRTVQTYLSERSFPTIANVLFRPYVHTPATMSVFTRNIRGYRDPIHMMLATTQLVTESVITWEDFVGKCALVSNTYGCLPDRPYIKVKNFRPRFCKEVVKNLLDRGAFAFAEKYPELMESLNMYVKFQRDYRAYKPELETLLGILYLQCRALTGRKLRKSIDRKMKIKNTNYDELLPRRLQRTILSKLESGESV